MPQREEVEWRGGRKVASDGTTSRSVKAFQFGKVGNAKKKETIWVKHE